MPIKSLVDNQQNKAEFSIGTDVQLSFCSDACLLKTLGDNARVVRTGQTNETALTVILGDSHLLVPLAGVRRPETHILGAQHGSANARTNWSKLVGCQHSALMPVHKVCDCMAEIQILDGEEFVDAATTPAWKKVRGIIGKRTRFDWKKQPVGFDQWRTWMGELAEGLDELEKLELAHGDPYPFNAICDGEHAKWVDFGHLTDDPVQRFKDAWAFVLFTVLHTQNSSAAYSPALLKNLASAMVQADQPGRFERIRAALQQPYADPLPIGDVRTPGLLFVEAVLEQSDKVFNNPTVPALLVKAAIQYFSAFLHHIQRGNHFSAAFNTEQQRHRFQEEEMLRLTVPRAEHLNQLDALRVSQNEFLAQKNDEIAKLNQGMVALNERLAEQQRIAEQAEQHNSNLVQANAALDNQLQEQKQLVALSEERSNQLSGSYAALDVQLTDSHLRATQQGEQNALLNQHLSEHAQYSTQLKRELDELFKRHEQVLNSRSWKLTRPMRGVARIARYGFNDSGTRQAMYRFAAKIGRTVPFPLWLKARVRAALVDKTPPPPPARPSVNVSSASQALTPLAGAQNLDSLYMRPENCGLVKDLVSVILPVYNQAYLIAESIDSVLRQTYQNFELIIINDGSKDGVEEVLERYVDHPKVRCYTQTNQRLPKALSNGFDFARGEFRTWTSADNIMEPQMLEQLVSKLRNDPTTAMVYADYYAIDDRGALLKDRTWRAHNRPDSESGEIRLPHSTETLNTTQDNFIGPCFMYRGWIGSCFGDYDTQLGIEDYDYWMRINAFFPVRHLGNDSVLYKYRVHDNTLSAQAQEHKILDKVQLLMEYEKTRAAFYQTPLAYVADSAGAAWLVAHGVAAGDIASLGDSIPENVLVVVGSPTAEQHTDRLLATPSPVAVLLQQGDTSYHKLRPLLSNGRCVALVSEQIGAERIRMVSTCPIWDAQTPVSLPAIRAFAKNLLFMRSTRSPQDMARIPPKAIRPARNRHVLLQVDSFTQGGMENVVIDLGLSLKAYGYRVTIANLGKAGDAAAKAQERGLEVVSFTTQLDDTAYVAWLRDRQVDVVNAHYSLYGAAACHKAGIPFIQTIHNSYVWLDAENIGKYREADRHTTEYLCVSVTAARYADVALGLDVAKLRVVPNGIDPGNIDASLFAENRDQMRQTWEIDAKTPVFLNVASIMATKAQLPLVKAFAKVVDKLPDARLVLLGTSMEAAYHGAVKNAIRDLRLQKNVLLAGYDRNVARYYHAADVFVLPSYWEGWSLSLGEAMANGLACVITDVGSAYEFEGRENVEVIAPPFGDIATLNYQNLGHYVYGEDAGFEQRLANAMIKAANHPRRPVDIALAESLDRNIAYRTYAEIFSKL